MFYVPRTAVAFTIGGKFDSRDVMMALVVLDIGIGLVRSFGPTGCLSAGKGSFLF